MNKFYFATSPCDDKRKGLLCVLHKNFIYVLVDIYANGTKSSGVRLHFRKKYSRIWRITAASESAEKGD